MKKSALLIILLLTIICAVFCIPQLNDDNYENVLKQKKVNVLYFTYDKSSVPEYLSKIERFSNVAFIDCNSDSDPCFDFRVGKKNAPQLIFHLHGDERRGREIYKGSNDADEIVDWAKGEVFGSVSYVDSDAKTKKLHHGLWILYFCTNDEKCSFITQQGDKIQKKVGTQDISSAYIDCRYLIEFCEKHDVKRYPTIQYWDEGDVESTYEGLRIDAKSISDWALGLKLPNYIAFPDPVPGEVQTIKLSEESGTISF